jgi:phosphoribosylformylglycinamidine synthase
MRVSIIVFPGSNCEHDAEHAYKELLGCETSLIWHREQDLKRPDVVVLPGGFSYGDYLRTGAMAKLSPAMKEVSKFAAKGGPLLGICNGFQILCEAGLLPGALLRNVKRKFCSEFVSLEIENISCAFTKGFKKGDVITCPIAHGEGNYYADPEVLKELEDSGRVVFRYKRNPNGSLNNIAGICNKAGNIVGLMPHPERASEKSVGWVGGESGLKVLQSVLN